MFALTPVKPDPRKGYELGEQWEYYAASMRVQWHMNNMPLPESLLSVYIADGNGQPGLVLMDYVDQWFTWETWNKLAEEGLSGRSGRPKAATSTTYSLQQNPSDKSIWMVELPLVEKRRAIGEDSHEDANQGTDLEEGLKALTIGGRTAERNRKRRKLEHNKVE